MINNKKFFLIYIICFFLFLTLILFPNYNSKTKLFTYFLKDKVESPFIFLSNEVRADALVVKVFYKNCSVQQTCKITDRSGVLSEDLTKKILSKAAVYEKENKSKKKK